MLLADAVPGEGSALFWAGALALAGTFVAVVTVWASYKEKPFTWNLGYFSIAFTSLGTALGLWKLAGESGWAFLGLAVLLAAGAVLGAMAWGRKWPIPPFQDAEVSAEEQDEPESDRSRPGPE